MLGWHNTFFMKKTTTKFIAINAIVAALYVILTMPLGVIAVNNFIQFRPAEALTILPALYPYTIIGLTIGCAISNMVSAFGIWDITLGATATLIAGLLSSSRLFNKKWLAPLPPIVVNAVALPLIWLITAPDVMYLTSMASLLLTQSVVIYGLGIPLWGLCDKRLRPMLELNHD